MDLKVVAYLALLTAVGAGRLLELRLSNRHRRSLIAKGARVVKEPHFRWMVFFHAGTLIAAALEVVLLRRPFLPALALTMGILFLLSNGLRWWVILTLAEHWNASVMASANLGVVTTGPYRWIRHPNYVAVFTELVSLPLIYSAWVTALLACVTQLWVLRERLVVEEATLMESSAYRAAMGDKPRFLPRLFAKPRT